jgi:phosphoglycerate dehydrogenase-like enzyme
VQEPDGRAEAERRGPARTNPGRAGHERIRIVLQLPRARYAQIFAPPVRERLASLAEVIGPFDGDDARRLTPRLPEADILFLQGAVEVDGATLAKAPHLRWISETSGGPPRIDYRVAFERGITVTDCRHAFGRSVAEMSLALYLAVARDVVAHDRALHTPADVEGRSKEQNWDASFRTLGLVGFGGLSRALLPFLAPLEPRLLAYDPFVPPDILTAAGVEPVGLQDLFRTCDAVFVLAMPTPENRALIGASELDLLKPDGILLVISRSWLVDEVALVERLRAGRFRAALDVFDVEPLPAGHPYRSLPNTVLTPHRAGGTREAYWRIGQALVDDLERFIAGSPPIHTTPVDADTARRLGRLTGP